jgi:hypothetical protein
VGTIVDETYPIGELLDSRQRDDKAIMLFPVLLHFAERMAESGYGPNGSARSSCKDMMIDQHARRIRLRNTKDKGHAHHTSYALHDIVENDNKYFRW